MAPQTLNPFVTRNDSNELAILQVGPIPTITPSCAPHRRARGHPRPAGLPSRPASVSPGGLWRRRRRWPSSLARVTLPPSSPASPPKSHSPRHHRQRSNDNTRASQISLSAFITERYAVAHGRHLALYFETDSSPDSRRRTTRR